MILFLKELNYAKELSKIEKTNNKNLIYGLIGEERVSYQLKKCQLNALCLYNIRLKNDLIKYQYDFIIITFDKIYIIEVKNLMGNILITKNGDVSRIIYKKTGKEECGIENPLIQMNEHVNFLNKILLQNNFTIDIEPILVMGNDKTIIYNYSNFKNIIKYEEVKQFLDNMPDNKTIVKECYDIANLLIGLNKEINYHKINYFRSNKKLYEDEYMKEILKVRARYSELYNIPACNIFNNEEAYRLVNSKPKNKEEFINIKGFKDKRYKMFGEDIIKIFKKTK